MPNYIETTLPGDTRRRAYYLEIRNPDVGFPEVQLAPKTMRQWLYGLSIDPASAANMGLLAQAMIDAPRSLGKRSPGEGQGDFGGGS